MIAEQYKAMLGAKSAIREMAAYGAKRGKEIGPENVFDYSLGNPSVPVPEKFTKKMISLLENESPVALHGYSPTLGIDSVRQAVEYLKDTAGNILIATGSKELNLYTAIDGYRDRCFARVLSTAEAVEESVKLGFQGRHLIAMQGPFSREMNLALLRQTGAEYFVTKESGKAGGFEEKLMAAEEAGAVLVVVGRPEENGERVESTKEIIRRKHTGQKK